MLASSAGSSDSFDLDNFAKDVADVAQPLVSIIGSIASVITAIAGVVISGNLLNDALSSDDLALII